MSRAVSAATKKPRAERNASAGQRGAVVRDLARAKSSNEQRLGCSKKTNGRRDPLRSQSPRGCQGEAAAPACPSLRQPYFAAESSMASATYATGASSRRAAARKSDSRYDCRIAGTSSVPASRKATCCGPASRPTSPGSTRPGDGISPLSGCIRGSLQGSAHEHASRPRGPRQGLQLNAPAILAASHDRGLSPAPAFARIAKRRAV